MTERELVIKYSQAKRDITDLKERLSAAQADLNDSEAKLLTMLDEESKNATASYEGVGQIKSQKPKLYASVLAENREVLAEYLNSINRNDMVTKYVFPNTLSSFVKEKIECGETVPDYIQYYLKPSLKLYN
jgi:septal ring factor EnvC (AmiA/AmiB activator)